MLRLLHPVLDPNQRLCIADRQQVATLSHHARVRACGLHKFDLKGMYATSFSIDDHGMIPYAKSGGLQIVQVVSVIVQP
jgi:hypothetical protein